MLTIKERFFYAVVVVLCGFLVWFFVFWKVTPPYEKMTILLNDNKYTELIKIGEPFLTENSQDNKFVILMSRAYFDFGVVSGERDLYTKKLWR